MRVTETKQISVDKFYTLRWMQSGKRPQKSSQAQSNYVSYISIVGILFHNQISSLFRIYSLDSRDVWLDFHIFFERQHQIFIQICLQFRKCRFKYILEISFVSAYCFGALWTWLRDFAIVIFVCIQILCSISLKIKKKNILWDCLNIKHFPNEILSISSNCWNKYLCGNSK